MSQRIREGREVSHKAESCSVPMGDPGTGLYRFPARVTTSGCGEAAGMVSVLAERAASEMREGEPPDHPSCSQNAHDGAVLVRCAQ